MNVKNLYSVIKLFIRFPHISRIKTIFTHFIQQGRPGDTQPLGGLAAITIAGGPGFRQ